MFLRVGEHLKTLFSIKFGSSDPLKSKVRQCVAFFPEILMIVYRKRFYSLWMYCICMLRNYDAQGHTDTSGASCTNLHYGLSQGLCLISFGLIFLTVHAFEFPVHKKLARFIKII